MNVWVTVKTHIICFALKLLSNTLLISADNNIINVNVQMYIVAYHLRNQEFLLGFKKYGLYTTKRSAPTFINFILFIF
jgi:hypothetical protein